MEAQPLPVLHLIVRGRVQGVCFRVSCQDQARRLGLSGWVRNLSDGSVELEAQGQAAALEALRDWCRRGPPAARVAGVEDLAPTDSTPPTGFHVRG